MGKNSFHNHEMMVLDEDIVDEKEEIKNAHAAGLARAHTTSVIGNDNDFSFPITELPQRTFVPTKLTTRDFKGVEYIGNGSNSSIFTAFRGTEKFAVKMLKENPKNLRVAEQELVLEAGILARLKHPNIIAINGVGEKIRKFIVLEYLEGGTMAQLLKGQKTNPPNGQIAAPKVAPILPLSNIINIALSLASALRYIHEEVHPLATIIHRDLKPQNIGFSRDGVLKLFDFGLMTCVKRRTYSTQAYLMTGYTGTVIYMAPEVALRQPYTEKVDIYSFGIILWQMTSGQVPFAGMYQDEFMAKVVKEHHRPKIREDLPKQLIHLIECCWDNDPQRRPSSSELVEVLEALREAMIKKERELIHGGPTGFGSSLFRFMRGGSSNNMKVADDSNSYYNSNYNNSGSNSSSSSSINHISTNNLSMFNRK